MKRVSIKDLASETNLSKTTISFILNGKGKENNISQETINKVQATAKRLNYQPNYLAKSLSLGKSNTIGLIVPRITDTFFAQIATIMEKKAGEKGYTVVYGSTEELQIKEQNLIDTFLGKQVDGLIIASSLQNEEGIKKLHSQHYPFVLIDRFYPTVNTSYVVVKNELGSYNIVNKLLAKNHQNIAMVTISAYLDLMKDRTNGYKRALKEYNIPFDPTIIKEVDLYDMENSTNHIIEELLTNPKKIDAIYFTTHYLASLGFKYLKSKGITIPNDIAICCFGDSPYLEILEPSITAIPMPAEQIGQEATRILFNKLELHTDEVEQVILPVQIVERESC
ncbi:LacI family DNA-binding transcriptional regulator [Bacteroides ovatus]|jgi:LacI family transcriptional regulator|uniref:LacI family DNA-binding transcriptional regulator n=1 Tax=Bacteroides ovatus TaxID=28116 RepID=UPI0032C1DE26